MLSHKRRVSQYVAALRRRQDFLPVEPERVATHDGGRFLEREAHEVLAKGLGEANIHLVVHEPHGDFRDARRPLADFNAVKSVHVHERQALDVQLLRFFLAGIEQFKNLNFQHTQFAVSDH